MRSWIGDNENATLLRRRCAFLQHHPRARHHGV